MKQRESKMPEAQEVVPAVSSSDAERPDPWKELDERLAILQQEQERLSERLRRAHARRRGRPRKMS